MRRTLLFVALIAPAALSAQGRAGDTSIPAAYQPPPGLCRIWVQGVPPDKQPAPTDCASAMKNNPPNGRVLFGPTSDTLRRRGAGQLLRTRGLPLPAAWRAPERAAEAPLPSRRDPAIGDSARSRDTAALRDAAARRDSSARGDSAARRPPPPDTSPGPPRD